MLSHETVCVLNTTEQTAHVRITVFFSDREPVGPYVVDVPPRRTRHVRFNDLTDPAPVPAGVDFASVIESDVPIVVQHTRLDSRQAENEHDRLRGRPVRRAARRHDHDLPGCHALTHRDVASPTISRQPPQE
jgi:hypothetical protein